MNALLPARDREQPAPLVPAGAHCYPLRAPGQTRHYAFLLVPGFTLLAFSSAVEPLRIANQLSQQPLYHWRTLSADGLPVTSSSGVPVVVDGIAAEPDRETSLFLCAGNDMAAAMPRSLLPLLQRHHRFGGVVGGICTGALALAKAGLLTSGRFTLHWENQPGFTERFPDLIPTGAKFEICGRVITSGGGAAATDMMLSLIAADHGTDFAAIVSEMCLRHVVIGTEKDQRSSLGAILHSRNPALTGAADLMAKHLEDLISMDDLALAIGYSRRQVERLFKTVLGTTPAAYYRRIRLDHARTLLSSTNMTLAEIAAACGFETVSHFSKAFKATFGSLPSMHGARRRRRADL